MSNSLDETPQWEITKENVKPLKIGRKIRDLESSRIKDIDIIKSTETWVDMLNLLSCPYIIHRIFQNNISQIDANLNAETCLHSWIEYIDWSRIAFPSNSNKTLELLEVISILIIFTVIM